MTDVKAIKQVRKHIENADAILITAGAGMGVDCGLPDFRGNEGFWKVNLYFLDETRLLEL